jgi:transcriptional regulator with XRE-family HTH domain
MANGWCPTPKDETLISLARALGVDPKELFRRVGRYEDRPPRAAAGARTAAGTAWPSWEERIRALEERNEELRAQNERTVALLCEAGIGRSSQVRTPG